MATDFDYGAHARYLEHHCITGHYDDFDTEAAAAYLREQIEAAFVSRAEASARFARLQEAAFKREKDLLDCAEAAHAEVARLKAKLDGIHGPANKLMSWIEEHDPEFARAIKGDAQ